MKLNYEDIGVISLFGEGTRYAIARKDQLYSEAINWANGDIVKNGKSIESIIKYFNSLDSDRTGTYKVIDSSAGDFKRLAMYNDIADVNKICLNFLSANEDGSNKVVKEAYKNNVELVIETLTENKRIFVKAYQENNQPLIALYRILVFAYIEMSYNINKHVFALTNELTADETGDSTFDLQDANDTGGEADMGSVAPEEAEQIITGVGNYIITGTLAMVRDKDFAKFIETMAIVSKEDRDKTMRETVCQTSGDIEIYKEVSLASVSKVISKGFAKFLFTLFGLARILTYYILYSDYVMKAKRVLEDSKKFYRTSHSNLNNGTTRDALQRDIDKTEEKKKAALKKTEELIDSEAKNNPKDTLLTEVVPKISDIEFVI